MNIINRIYLNEHELSVIPKLTNKEKSDYLKYLYDGEVRKDTDTNMVHVLNKYFDNLDLDEIENMPEDEIEFLLEDDAENLEDSITDFEIESDEDSNISFHQIDFSDADSIDPSMPIVDVTMDDTNILIESNSLKYLRKTINKFAENGYILTRDTDLEADFKPSKSLRYLRVYEIVSITVPICLN